MAATPPAASITKPNHKIEICHRLSYRLTLANYRIAIPKGDVGERQGRRLSIAEALWRKSSNWFIDLLALRITT
ncbi:hypothetical protein [Microbulbifer sp. THAF38]|uniref:hypothetical protein n=1 Tax=Microbulbifer sp. THAF38 TaxID=2587856 RepID=UPI001268A5DF|nr:hypothetical protein [Microbulbifer sp. THAF38]